MSRTPLKAVMLRVAKGEQRGVGYSWGLLFPGAGATAAELGLEGRKRRMSHGGDDLLGEDV